MDDAAVSVLQQTAKKFIDRTHSVFPGVMIEVVSVSVVTQIPSINSRRHKYRFLQESQESDGPSSELTVTILISSNIYPWKPPSEFEYAPAVFHGFQQNYTQFLDQLHQVSDVFKKPTVQINPGNQAGIQTPIHDIEGNNQETRSESSSPKSSVVIIIIASVSAAALLVVLVFGILFVRRRTPHSSGQSTQQMSVKSSAGNVPQSLHLSNEADSVSSYTEPAAEFSTTRTSDWSRPRDFLVPKTPNAIDSSDDEHDLIGVFGTNRSPQITDPRMQWNLRLDEAEI